MKIIELNNGGETQVDDEDYEQWHDYPWRLGGSYVRSDLGSEHLILHRVIMDAPKGSHVHHKDGDPLNNTKSNLEVLSPAAHATAHSLARMPPRVPAGVSCSVTGEGSERVRVWDEEPPVPWKVIDAQRNARSREQQR